MARKRQKSAKILLCWLRKESFEAVDSQAAGGFAEELTGKNLVLSNFGDSKNYLRRLSNGLAALFGEGGKGFCSVFDCRLFRRRADFCFVLKGNSGLIGGECPVKR